jgi:hypothetical protein
MPGERQNNDPSIERFTLARYTNPILDPPHPHAYRPSDTTRRLFRAILSTPTKLRRRSSGPQESEATRRLA